MVVTIFRSRLMPDIAGDYVPLAEHMSELAATMPGYIFHKRFVAEDGERVTLVAFESAEAQRAWAQHPEHRQAQKQGRERFYSEYHIQVCELVRESKFNRTTQN
jgi:heme-degrading monooxygenase HmoA